MRESIEDSYRHRGMRRALLGKLREKGIHDERVLHAIGQIPRHIFFDAAFLEHAYQDKAFPIGEGQTISQPYTVARQTELLDVGPGMKTLEVGTGSGYQAWVLALLGAKVFSVERIPALYQKALHLFRRLPYAVQLHLGDGTLGWKSRAPFERILVTAGAPFVPDALLEQLSLGGKLVIPVGDDQQQRMIRLTKLAGNEIRKEEFEVYRFVPLKGKLGWNE
ncbi:protein-L-isoaspartate(D-aspartate) O-methyltransferase [Catalinimonas alkaloidigena]|uniref:Protein-L-isoaspartate O-methyltransferase n=1 Tax=Catalinimonas alkaloidigena TaxID=1075417 RepID=A0A1G9IS93_9BACT|nr:protein-L-isoaspartate(D-aspartate) O-methyltransferase [Catalinimonas alkaloidigena]SDL27896.1 protein-L-isoaspartate(D-aspartate) O-methyltransferase [Catalinimonas alkaloidigena]